MPDYLLFVDTETSGLPTDWRRPYAEPGAWPHVAQVAWLLYTAEGELLKRENHYIKPSDYDLTPASVQVHGLTLAYLHEHGKPRRQVMQRLHDDLLRYRPLVVGHFVELDYHMVGVSFQRADLPNALLGLNTFCTMRLSGSFSQTWQRRYLRLGELYDRLFNRLMPRQHDALADAEATAECFFELRRHGDITEATLASQPRLAPPTGRPRATHPPTRPFWKYWLGIS
ncbi:3'-5' exonuclease [Hymenobacter sp. RP-2-7]|uniref:3'-5' exonuclease n=1 Tax=Hymenobacter polaris TaxID=2682546 RepID=A0A7Y0AAN0_9BACT|nr:3'-5' exonuclease [Hymenobacter polaris]NML63864.1 3'-5' exonuclease [Hymenobacter polaris]